MSMNGLNHKDNFEEYLQQQANEHRMYPSDYVWKNIRKKIHTPKKWPALSVFTVLIISALVIGTVLNKPVPDTVTANFHFSLQSPVNAVTNKSTDATNTGATVTDEHYAADQLTSTTIIAAVEKIKIDDAVAKQLVNPTLPIINEKIIAAVSSNDLEINEKAIAAKSVGASVNKTENNNASLSLDNVNYYLFNLTSRLKSILNTDPSQVKSGGVAFFKPRITELKYDNDFDFKVEPEHTDLFPNALQQLSKNSTRFDFRFYVTPSVSYRHLNEKEQASNAGKTIALESSYKVNPSQAIHQRPAIGYETGFGLGYHLNNNFTLTGGFQFNISQYKIDAFLYKDEPVALTLNDGKFSNTIDAVSSLRSIPGTKPLTIKNRYYQIAIPIGLEWTMLNNSKYSWSLAGALQPTYTFDKQPLIISSNYKNYTDGSAYVRNFNVNANLETYFGYTTGNYRWQIGPQVRYQLLPSLVDKYPNKEYLINYGLKVGVVKQLH